MTKPIASDRVDAADVECPTCNAWIGWACEGPNYGYHAAGYHRSRERAAERAAAGDSRLTSQQDH